VILVWFSNVSPTAFGEDQLVGGLVFDVNGDLAAEAKRIAAKIGPKLKLRKLVT
jgi:hypothetical protein